MGRVREGSVLILCALPHCLSTHSVVSWQTPTYIVHSVASMQARRQRYKAAINEKRKYKAKTPSWDIISRKAHSQHHGGTPLSHFASLNVTARR